MAVCVDSCPAQQTIVITTGSSVYELVALGDQGVVLVRGGRHFAEVTRVLFLGSSAEDGSLQPRAIGIGLCMRFFCGDRFVITSPIKSFTCRSEAAAQWPDHTCAL